MSDALGEWLAVWVSWVQRHPRAIVAAVMLLSVGAGIYGYFYSRIDSDLSKLIKPSTDLAWYREDNYFKAAFPALQQTAVVVVSGKQSSSVDAMARKVRDGLVAADKFEEVSAPALSPFMASHRLYFLNTDQLKRWLQAVEYNYGAMLRLTDAASVANFAATLADQLSSPLPGPLPQPLTSIAQSLGTTPKVAAYPRLEPRDNKTHYQLIVVKGRQNHAVSLPNAAIVAAIHHVIDAIPAAPGIRVRLTGEVELANEDIKEGLSGVEIAATISVILLAVILGFGIRSLRLIAMIFAMLACGVVLSMGFAAFAVGSYNTLSLIFVVMFFGLGVDFGVHFVLRATEDSDNHGAVSAARDLGSALLLCMLTSAIAFLSFLPTAYAGLGQLGVISAGSLVIAFLLTMTLIPALLAIFGTPVLALGKQRSGWNFVLPPRLVLIVAALLTLVAGYMAKDAHFDYSVLAMRNTHTEGMSTLLELQRAKVATEYSINVIAPNEAAARRLKARLLKLPQVGSVDLPTDMIPKHQAQKRQMMAGALDLYNDISSVTPGHSGKALGQAIQRLISMKPHLPATQQKLIEAVVPRLQALESDPARLRQTDAALHRAIRSELDRLRHLLSAQPFAFSDLPKSIRERMETARGEMLIKVQPAAPLTSRARTQAFITAVQKVAPNIAGRAVVEWGVGNVVVQAFEFAGKFTLAVIFILLLVYFRNIRLPIMVLTPILLASIFTLALTRISALTLNMANVLVIPLIIGLGVDAGIHVVHRFVQAGSIEEIYRSSTSRAVLISALTTIGTFFSLSFSPHKGAASVGMLLTIAISLMLICTFIVLPALLRVFGTSEKLASRP